MQIANGSEWSDIFGINSSISQNELQEKLLECAQCILNYGFDEVWADWLALFLLAKILLIAN